MSILQNERHYSDAELIACEIAEKLAKNAMKIINEQPSQSAINSTEMLATLVMSQAVVYLCHCYITPLISELKVTNERLSDIAESTDFIASKSEV